MSYYGFRPYVPVANRRLQALREITRLEKNGHTVSPVEIEGRTIARSFWGKAWCENLERYSDYENRLPRGRTYVRNGSVLDLQIERGQIKARVAGSDIYSVKIDIGTLAPARWKAICRDCLGTIGSLVELLSGRLSENVMERVCRKGDGLFPGPREIKMSCSCPDWAGLCKHVAAAMYGAGARLDAAPDLLFTLRGVDRADLIASAGTDLAMTRTGVMTKRRLADDDVAALFGADLVPAPFAPETADMKAKPMAKRSRGARPLKAPKGTDPPQERVRAGAKRSNKTTPSAPVPAPPTRSPRQVRMKATELARSRGRKAR